LDTLNTQLTELRNFVETGLSDARSDISDIYTRKVANLTFSFRKTIDAVQEISDDFSEYITTQPSLFPECVEDAKLLLEAAKVMAGWMVASCHKNVWTVYHNEVTQRYDSVATVQTQINGYLTEYLNHLKGKNVFKITDWDAALVDLKQYYEEQNESLGGGVDLHLDTFEQVLTKVNEEYGLCNGKAETRFADQSENIRNYDLPACNLKMLRMRLLSVYQP
jgi:hypothetical protein